MVVDTNCRHRPLQQCQSTEDYVSDSDRIKRKLQVLSCGLAKVTPSSDTQDVRFIHRSVKDFFVEKDLSVLDGSLRTTETEANLAVGSAHYRLSRTCIRYLTMEEISRSTTHDRDDLMSTFPLLRYPTTWWVAHAQQSEKRKVSPDNLLDYLEWPSEALVQLWVRVYRITDRYSDDCPPEGTSVLHIVSRYQFMGPLRVILQKADQVGSGIDGKDSLDRTPLRWAAESGHETVVQLLLEKGADIESKDRNNLTPLLWAAANGDDAVVWLLQLNPSS